MKKIVFIIIALLIAIVTMAYLYFSGLNFEQKSNKHSLYVAAANSSLIFSFENDQSIIDILKGQNLLQELIGGEKFSQLVALNEELLSIPGLRRIIDHQSIYLGLNPGHDQSIDFVYSTQIGPDFKADQLLQTLKTGKATLDFSKEIITISLKDSTIFFAGIKDNLLVLSTSMDLVKKALTTSTEKTNNFAEFIKTNSRIAKNSLAEVYVNFESLPTLLKVTMPGKLSGELTPLNNQHAYSALIYNYSKEKILLTGTTTLQNNNYYKLFVNSPATKIDISNILPENTANYTAYGIADYPRFRKSLTQWLKNNKEDQKIDEVIKGINKTYRIDSEKLLPAFFNDQIITFQLSTSEKIGAINLTNGDKLEQLLLELSTTYNEDIKSLKVSGLLYAFYGAAFSNFKRPYYAIFDNYMVFANNASTLEDFLNSYKNNRLLISSASYGNAMEQLPVTSNIHFFINLENSSRIIQQNLYLPFFRHIYSDKGLKSYSSLSLQLSSDNYKFLSNLLMVKKPIIKATDSSSISP